MTTAARIIAGSLATLAMVALTALPADAASRHHAVHTQPIVPAVGCMSWPGRIHPAVCLIANRGIVR